MRKNKKLNYGILVGIFDEDELNKGTQDKLIDKMQEKYPKHQFLNWIETKKNGKRAMKIYVCELKDLQMRL